jgi:hypothetical protein
MKKRAQVTVFIIIAILIIAIIVLFFIFREKLLPEEKVDIQVQPIHSYVENCIKEIAEDAIYTIGRKGGYFLSPELSTESGVTYYFDKGKSYMPSKEIIENEISLYVDEMLFFCTKNFVDFPDFNVKQRRIKTKATITDDNVILNIEYPLSISKGETTHSFKRFEDIEISVRLGIIYNTMDEIMREQMTHKENICLSCIVDLALKNDLYVEMQDYDDETVIFTFRDENIKLNEEDYRFTFANRYKR